jgi:hypothetical protein
MGERLENPGQEDRFTCPSCYHDFEDMSATKCPACGEALHCWITTQPVAVCELGAADADED